MIKLPLFLEKAGNLQEARNSEMVREMSRKMPKVGGFVFVRENVPTSLFNVLVILCFGK